MNQFNFNQVGGFPMTTRILDELQKAFAVFNGLGAISGDKTIISGCVTTGSNVSDGVVYVNGEVFEFKGGSAQTKVKIVEVVETLVFEDGAAKSVIKTRYVTFGTGVGAMDWVDFKRGFETKEIPAALELKEDKTAAAALAARVTALESVLITTIPSGLIAIWGQAANLIPAGWTEYTPLSGRMPVGYDSSIPGFDTLGFAAGSKTHANTAAEMAPHKHPIQTNNKNAAGSGSEKVLVNSETDAAVGTGGTGTPYDIMNPYRVVLYIQKT